ncbi:MAG: hypothetical protein WBI07_14480 [Mobilitalea sp.]
MKKCKKCGAIQDNTHNKCIECGQPLSAPLTKEEEAGVKAGMSEEMLKLFNKKDYFHISRLDIIAAMLLIIDAVLYVITLMTKQELLMEKGFLPITSVLLLIILMQAIGLLLPKVSWAFYKMRLKFQIDNPENLSPTTTVVFMKRFMACAVLVGTYIFIIYLFLQK